jgi:hypothetical protein
MLYATNKMEDAKGALQVSQRMPYTNHLAC